VHRQPVGLEQVHERQRALHAVAGGELRRAEVGQQQRRAVAGAVGAQQRGVVEECAARAERHRDAVLGGRAGQAVVDDARLARAPRHRRDEHRRCQARPEQLDLEGHVVEVAAGQRAVAQADGVQARAATVDDAGARGDPQVIGLACAGGLERRRDRGPDGGHRLR
jgi:hypothetical protein